MAINGIETVVYGVNDLAECTRFFLDFGLPLMEQGEDQTHFRLDEGSNVLLRQINDPRLPKTGMSGTGAIEVIWGVDRQVSLDKLVAGLQRDREVHIDADGTAHSHDDDGMPFGLRVFVKNPVISAPDPVNSPGRINRFNVHRKWKTKARPKTIQHIVFAFPDVEKTWNFYRERLGFRLSDVHQGFGIFCRGDGANDHHNLYIMNAHLAFLGNTGQHTFHHLNFGVEDLDEIMIGANHLERRGWPKSKWGLGRHRMGSSLFMYFDCPTGGEAEYGTDSDFIDDSWIPRVWNAAFGGFTYVHNMVLPFLREEQPWEWEYAPGYTPERKPGQPGHGGHGGNPHAAPTPTAPSPAAPPPAGEQRNEH